MDIDTTDPAVRRIRTPAGDPARSEEHTSELQSRLHLVCRLLLEKKKKKTIRSHRIKESKLWREKLCYKHTLRDDSSLVHYSSGIHYPPLPRNFELSLFNHLYE